MDESKALLAKTVPVTAIVPGEHLIFEFVGDDSGPTFIVFGSVHGNEPAGFRALVRVSQGLRRDAPPINGRVFFFAGNTRALEKGVRFIDRDLNRHWTGPNLERNRVGSTETHLFAEDIEQRELLSLIGPILETARDEVYALDLHSTSAFGLPFATVGDTMRNRRFAQRLPVTILLGIEEQLEGTLLEYLNNLGTVTFGFEGGQHDAPATVDTHEALVWLAMEAAGTIATGELKHADKFARIVRKATGELRILEVRYRHAIRNEDDFRMLPGFVNFEPIRKGEHLADDAAGHVVANESGLLLMPLYQKQGEDGFFIGRIVRPFWLWLSWVLRTLKVADIVHWLPGVSKNDGRVEVLNVNTSIARLFPLQVFHLLGFRKLRWEKNRLVVSRRRHDTRSPFRGRGPSGEVRA